MGCINSSAVEKAKDAAATEPATAAEPSETEEKLEALELVKVEDSTTKAEGRVAESATFDEPATVPEVAPEARQTEAREERYPAPSIEEQQLVTPEFQTEPVEARAGSTGGMFG
eukprot:CAMPEP_0194503812 /NCGR_PEP_ID=MMETSP0253-20130528/28592_1 /TAXON_ID=2966 /ORGANISM="Noctiluca scintillans" /LENGTH=113 /DNA_ID=CAMNT_0039346135 /DNA_START=31 /DNA_END=368 /DNA_ORIENTATION=+